MRSAGVPPGLALPGARGGFALLVGIAAFTRAFPAAAPVAATALTVGLHSAAARAGAWARAWTGAGSWSWSWRFAESIRDGIMRHVVPGVHVCRVDEHACHILQICREHPRWHYAPRSPWCPCLPSRRTRLPHLADLPRASAMALCAT